MKIRTFMFQKRNIDFNRETDRKGERGSRTAKVAIIQPWRNLSIALHQPSRHNERRDHAMTQSFPTFEGFRVHRMLGRGAGGTVYLATDLQRHSAVAIKAFAEGVLDEQSQARFFREARLLIENPHPSLLPLLGAKLRATPPYLILEYMPGGDLSAWTSTHQLLPTWRVYQVGACVASALTHLHDRRIIHRDVKPGNILIGETSDFFLADLGIGRSLRDPGLTASNLALGTPSYMAPELFSGSAPGPNTDLYALMVTMLQLLTGELLPAPVGDREAFLERISRHVPPEFSPLMRRGLRLLPDSRGPSLREVERQLRELCQVQEEEERTTSAAAIQAISGSDRTETLFDLSAPASRRPPSPPPSTPNLFPDKVPPEQSPPEDNSKLPKENKQARKRVPLWWCRGIRGRTFFLAACTLMIALGGTYWPFRHRPQNNSGPTPSREDFTPTHFQQEMDHATFSRPQEPSILSSVPKWVETLRQNNEQVLLVLKDSQSRGLAVLHRRFRYDESPNRQFEYRFLSLDFASFKVLRSCRIAGGEDLLLPLHEIYFREGAMTCYIQHSPSKSSPQRVLVQWTPSDELFFHPLTSLPWPKAAPPVSRVRVVALSSKGVWLEGNNQWLHLPHGASPIKRYQLTKGNIVGYRLLIDNLLLLTSSQEILSLSSGDLGGSP
jgi:serine/threonine-protein kinase